LSAEQHDDQIRREEEGRRVAVGQRRALREALEKIGVVHGRLQEPRAAFLILRRPRNGKEIHRGDNVNVSIAIL
jgi:hypothetical protein